MLKRLRKRHPIGYCVLVEILFLALMIGGSFLIALAMVFVGVDIMQMDDYLLSIVQELIGTALAFFFLARTGRLEILRRRGCGFLNGLLVGMYPLFLIANSLIQNLAFAPADVPMRPMHLILIYLLAMTLVGVAEEMLFRGVVAQTLLEHFGTSRAGVWKACLLSGLLFGAAHLTNLLGSAPFGVLMQVIFSASLGTLYAAIYFRTGNLWVTVLLHAGTDITSMILGGLYGIVSLEETVSSYDATMLLSVLIYLIPTAFLLRKKKLGEVAIYSDYSALD
ncbi:MAG: lysostaphin resistance A-like protein [Faecalibacterium sp.]